MIGKHVVKGKRRYRPSVKQDESKYQRVVLENLGTLINKNDVKKYVTIDKGIGGNPHEDSMQDLLSMDPDSYTTERLQDFDQETMHEVKLYNFDEI